MTALETGCQCKAWPVPCKARMTQEDLLCGNCRDGCSLAGILGVKGSTAHVKVTDFKFTVDHRA